MKVTKNEISKFLILLLTISLNLITSIKLAHKNSNNILLSEKKIQSKSINPQNSLTNAVVQTAQIMASGTSSSTQRSSDNLKTTVSSTPGVSADFMPTLTPTVIGQIFKVIKKMKANDSDLQDECVKILTGTKNEENMRTLWTKIKDSQMATPQGIIKRDFFREFILSNEEGLVVEGLERKCKDIVVKNIIESSEFENEQKQRELKEIVYPYFPVKVKSYSGKNIITAFIGVHRDTSVGASLIPKLNGNI